MNFIQAIYLITALCIGSSLEISEGKRSTGDRAKQERTLYKPINMESNPLRKWTKVIRKQEAPKPEKTTKKN